MYSDSGVARAVVVVEVRRRVRRMLRVGRCIFGGRVVWR